MTASSDPAATVAEKRALREAAALRRRMAVGALPPADAGRLARDALLAAIAIPEGVPVSAFWPLEEEFDPRPMIEHFHATGHPVGLPVVVRRGEPLVFRRWLPGMEMTAGSFRVMTPPPEAPEVTPVVLLVPLLAFDAAGYRLGYGGGFYDRTIARLRAAGRIVAIGVGYAAQEVPAVPREPTDERLDWIVTEQGARRIAGASASGNRY